MQVVDEFIALINARVEHRVDLQDRNLTKDQTEFLKNAELEHLYSKVKTFELFLGDDYQFRLYALEDLIMYKNLSFGEAICDNKKVISNTWLVVGEYTADDILCVDLLNGRCFSCSFGFEPTPFSFSLTEGLLKIENFGGSSIIWLEDIFYPPFNMCDDI